MRRLAAAIDGVFSVACEVCSPVVSLVRRSDRMIRASHPSGSRLEAVVKPAQPLTHFASQKRSGKTSACPIGRCTELVAHRCLWNRRPTPCGSRARRGHHNATSFLAGAASNQAWWFSQPPMLADRTDQAVKRILCPARSRLAHARRETRRARGLCATALIATMAFVLEALRS